MSAVEVAVPAAVAPPARESISPRGAYTVTFLARASQMGTIAIVAPYLLDRGVPVGYIGVVMVFAALGATAAGLVSGKLVDRFGAWRALVCGLMVAVIGVLAFIFVPVWPLMGPAYLVSTAGTSTANTALRTTIALGTPKEEHERTFGTLNSIGTTGALIGPLLVGFVVIDGTAAAPWFAAAMLSTATVVAFLLRRPAVADPEVPAAGDSTPEPATMASVGRAIAPIVALVTTSATMYGVYAVLWGLFLRGLGASNLVIAWSFVATMLPVVLLSRYADRVLPRTNRWLVSGGATMLLGALAFAYAYTGTVWLAIVLSVVEGLLMAVSVPVTYALIARHAPAGGTGRAFGIASAADSISSGAGTLLAGLIIATGGVAFAFQLAGAYCLVGTFVGLLWWARRARAARAVPA
ncbi:MFS transporter [Luedemannella flava]|uniref:MFS transporter n=1 Tax=Luedemannella flava TaxID=349316 RepID=A0ABN2LTQ4_9ACTN